MDLDEIFWSSSVDDLKRGYIFNMEKESYICLICGESYEKGIVYKSDDRLMEAEKAVLNHIKDKHVSMFEFLINMDKKYTGLTQHQRDLLLMFYTGYTDKEIVEKTSINSTSTVRNQRFMFREKEKQAKIFLAIMESLNEGKRSGKSSDGQELVSIHRGATMVDERYAITESEKESVLETYFDHHDGLRLKSFPSKEKKKIIILQHIIMKFDANVKYSEKEVNSILKSIYDDFATIRRYLIEYGFMARTVDCSEYWVKK